MTRAHPEEQSFVGCAMEDNFAAEGPSSLALGRANNQLKGSSKNKRQINLKKESSTASVFWRWDLQGGDDEPGD
jgi:hypothetical protein